MPIQNPLSGYSNGVPGNTEAMAAAVAEGAKAKGADLVCDSVTCNEAPDEEGTQNCRSLGGALAS